jgi:hypothetical protein
VWRPDHVAADLRVLRVGPEDRGSVIHTRRSQREPRGFDSLG